MNPLSALTFISFIYIFYFIFRRGAGKEKNYLPRVQLPFEISEEATVLKDFFFLPKKFLKIHNNELIFLPMEMYICVCRFFC